MQLITEYCQLGSINQLLDQQKDITGDARISLAFAVVVQVNRALAYLKTQNPPIFHRDIKFENVLVDANGVVKLADLGLAATHDMGQTHTQGAGTPRWLAPEVLNGREYDYPSDQYSLALVALRVLKGVMKNHGELDVPADCKDPMLMEYLEQQLSTDPLSRMTAEEVLTKFKGRGTSMRGVRLPPSKERLISPDAIPWQQTTEAERKANDELRRLAIMFTQSMDEEKDIAVLADILHLLPFIGTWTTKRGLAVQRNADGSILLPRGVLGPTAPQTPFKVAFMRNKVGRDHEEEEEGDSGDKRNMHFGSGTAPVARRLVPRELEPSFGEDSDAAPTRKLPVASAAARRRVDMMPKSPSAPPRARHSGISNRRVTTRGKSALENANHDETATAKREEDSDPETPTKKMSGKVPVVRRPSAPRLPRRSSAQPEYADGDSGEEEAEEEDDDSMDVDEDGATSDFEDERGSSPRDRRRQAPSRRTSKLSESTPLAVRRPVRAAAVASGPQALVHEQRRRLPRRGASGQPSASSSSNNNTFDGGISLEHEKESWDEFSLDEKLDKILGSDEWHASLDEWSKIRRLGIPEDQNQVRMMFSSILETDIGERDWAKAHTSAFAKKVWDWVHVTHGLWREQNRGKKRKRV